VKVDGHVAEAVDKDRKVHVSPKIEGHKRADNHGDGGMMEEVEKGDLPKRASQDEEIRVQEFKVLWVFGGGRGDMQDNVGGDERSVRSRSG